MRNVAGRSGRYSTMQGDERNCGIAW